LDDEALEEFKTHRLKTVSIATVDRELSTAPKMFGVVLAKLALSAESSLYHCVD